jgi:hypothetical protein
LRRSHNSSKFSPPTGDVAGYSGGYTGDFPQRGRIFTAHGAKLAAVRPDQIQNAAQGLPSDGVAHGETSPQSLRSANSLLPKTSSTGVLREAQNSTLEFKAGLAERGFRF